MVIPVRASGWVICLVVAVSTSWYGYTAGEDDNSEEAMSVFKHELPEELEKEISIGVEEIRVTVEISDEQLECMKTRLVKLTTKHTPEDDETFLFFRTLAMKALPFLEEVLRSKDIEIRTRGIYALARVVKPREYWDERERERLDKFVVPTLLRSLYDHAPEIRVAAIGALGTIAFEQFPNSNERIIASIKTMVSDEDPHVSFSACVNLYVLGYKEAIPPDILRDFGNLILN